MSRFERLFVMIKHIAMLIHVMVRIDTTHFRDDDQAF